MLGILQASPNEPFPYANFALYPLSVINHSWDYDYMLSPMSLPRKSSNLGVVMGIPSYIYLSPLNQTLEIQINNIKLPPKNLNFKLGRSKSKIFPTPLFFSYFVTYLHEWH